MGLFDIEGLIKSHPHWRRSRSRTVTVCRRRQTVPTANCFLFVVLEV